MRVCLIGSKLHKMKVCCPNIHFWTKPNNIHLYILYRGQNVFLLQNISLDPFELKFDFILILWFMKFNLNRFINGLS